MRRVERHLQDQQVRRKLECVYRNEIVLFVCVGVFMREEGMFSDVDLILCVFV